MNTATNAAAPQNVRALPVRSVTYARSRGSRKVEVVEQKYVDGRTYLIVITGLFTGAQTIVGPVWSQAEALRMARTESF